MVDTMASATIKRTCAKCSKCDKSAICYGCKHVFCTKHFIEHRQELSQQMDNIGQEHDRLQRDLVHQHSTHPLLARVNQWEQESITQIQVVAETARTDLRQLLDRAKNDLKTSVSKMTKELQSSRESDDYTEIDITKWMEQLKEIRKMLDNPSAVTIDYDNDSRSAVRLIKVRDQDTSNVSSHTSRTYQENDDTSPKLIILCDERFDEFLGEVELSEDLLTATCLESSSVGQCVSGIGRYSSGTHRIRFRIEQVTDGYYNFFCIVTSSQEMAVGLWNTSSAHGWWELDFPVVNGKPSKKNFTKIIRRGDEVTLTLACDNRRIELEHHRTNRVDHIPIDLGHCPFPWKIAVSLFSKDDCVRILR